MKKRLFAALLALAMALALLPSAALADNATSVSIGSATLNSTTPYYKNGAAIATNDATGYNARFDSSTGILYLNRLTLEDYNGVCISATDDLTIDLTGTSVVSTVASDNSTTIMAIFIDGRLTVQGTGSLSAAVKGTSSNGSNYGVRVAGNITVTGGVLKGTGGNAGRAAGSSHGVYAGSIAVSGTGILTGEGGTATGTSGNSYGVFVDSGNTGLNSIELTDGALTGVSGNATAESAGVYSAGSITVSGTGTLTGESGTAGASGTSYGVFVLRPDISAGPFKLTVLGGTVLAKSGTGSPSQALNMQPDFGTTPTWYRWRIGAGDAYTASATTPYVWDVPLKHTYVEIRSADPIIGTESLPGGMVNMAYNGTVLASGTDPITLSLIGDLPDGLTFASTPGTDSAECTITGTPTAAGSYTFTIRAANGSGRTDTRRYTIVISDYIGSLITVSPAATFSQGNAPQTVVTIGAGVADFNATNNYDGLHSTSQLKPNLGGVGTPGTDGKVEDGSIKLTLYQSYLNTLAPGAYRLRVRLKGDGYPTYVETRINVTAPDIPKTGDTAMPYLLAGLMLLAGAGLVVLRRRRRS